MLMINIANMQAVPNEMGPLQFAAGSHTHDLGRYALNASQCGRIAARSYGCTDSHTPATDNYSCPCVCASQSPQVVRLLPMAKSAAKAGCTHLLLMLQ